MPYGLAHFSPLPDFGRPGTAHYPSRDEAMVMAPFSGLCRNVTAQSHLDLKVWSCHTLRNELLGTASVSLGNLLKSGGKCMYEPDPTGGPWSPPWLGALHSAGSFCLACPVGVQWGEEAVATAAPVQSPAPGRNKVPLCALGRLSGPGGRGVTEAIPLLARVPQPARKHKPLSYLLPFVVARVWLVTVATA